MALQVNVGPLPEDGTRINVDRELDAYINGTVVTNFGAESFANNQDINFVVSATNAPETSLRSAGMLWFARGEGVLYFWDAQQASESIALWCAISNRKEIVVRLQSATKTGSVVWMDTNAGQGQFTEYYGVQINHRMVMKVSSTEHSAPFVDLRELPAPPYFVINEAVEPDFPVTGASGVGAGVFKVATELGYTRAQVDGVGAGAGVLQSSSPDTRYDAWLVSGTPLGFSNSWGAHVVGSGPVAQDGTLLVYIKGTPANVGW